MSNPPNPVNKTALSRAGIAGGILGVFGILLFLALWFVMGQAGVQQYTRLFLALCIPPAVIALLVGVYALWWRRRRDKR